MVNSTKTQKKVFTTRLIWCIIKTKQNKTKKNKEKRENKCISLTLKLRKSSSLRRNFNTVNRSIKNQAVRIKNSLAETEKTLNKIASNEDIKNKKEKNKKN